MKEIVISFEKYTKNIKGSTILDNINLQLEKGNIYGIIGRNGSGKSMLFKALCGLIKASEGKVKVNGKEIGKEVDFPENIGILIEHPGFLEHLSGYDNLKYLAEIQNKIDEKDIINALDLVELDYKDKRSVKKYSLGMKQRLGIAQAIMEDPEIIVLDEPMNGLDNDGVKKVRKLILELKNKNKTIILASHNSEDIQLLCDKVYEIDKGQIQN
ncbi:ATP-binding cassette domain-containing protein [Clostridium sp. 'White wine YQ']|uniref:ATP-binding cassette domain-containing protein n=1 Tax=Clostridium sp. 'White wine YQ' TaxID=3027474 RepID=UPI002366EE6E|nr:ATP-binding cassette domain-containing protein [Clostridium sp. 'White wine YQ']MDD7796064.1 ATP-binding cassette domain-containing protein [Clostridium sp. 'White wine YQ']